MVGVTEWGLRECCKVQEGYSEHSWGGVRVYWEGVKGEGEGERRGHLLEE